MAIRVNGRAAAMLSLTALGFVMAPLGAFAQGRDTGGSGTAASDALNRHINLDVRDANLYYALTLMFDQLKIGNYTIPEPLKQLKANAHFTDLPLRTALDTLLKNSGYTYKVEDGVYSVLMKVEHSSDPALDVPTNLPDIGSHDKKIYHITSNQILYNSVDIVTRLGGRVLPGAVGLQSGGRGGSGGLGAGAGLGNGNNSGIGGGIGGFSSGIGARGFGGGTGGFESGGTGGLSNSGRRGGGGF